MPALHSSAGQRPAGLAALVLVSVLAVVAWVMMSACARTAPADRTARPSAGAATARSLRVDFLDVGHGDAVLITAPGGKTVLIDGGFGEAGERVASFVASRIPSPLDLVMLTHRHADHLGGLSTVIERQGARLFMDAAFAHPSPAYDALIRALERRRIPIREAERGRVVELGGDARLVLLTPPQPPITGSRSDVNANSVVTQLRFGRVRMLFTADAEAVTERWLMEQAGDLRADVLQLAHHGSRHSSTQRFLAAVAPGTAIASCGSPPQVGHMHAETVDRVAAIGAKLYRTDRDGNITVWTDGQAIRVETQHQAHPRPLNAPPPPAKSVQAIATQ